MVSYADSFFFGITADYDSAPDVDALAWQHRETGCGAGELGRARRARKTLGLNELIG
jgi:hypothetical protein